MNTEEKVYELERRVKDLEFALVMTFIALVIITIIGCIKMLGYDPLKVVILDYSPDGHIWRHDFYRDRYGFGCSKVQEFVDTFKGLNNFVGRGIKSKVGIEVYEYKDLPERYKDIKPIIQEGIF